MQKHSLLNVRLEIEERRRILSYFCQKIETYKKPPIPVSLPLSGPGFQLQLQWGAGGRATEPEEAGTSPELNFGLMHLPGRGGGGGAVVDASGATCLAGIARQTMGLELPGESIEASHC